MNDKIHCNSKRLVSVLDPTDEYDAVNKKYVDNQNSQKTITSNLDMKTFEIINLSPGTDPRSAVTKDQLDMAIQETLIPGGKRYLEYSYIISNFKPGFWISSHFNNGLIIKSSNDPRDQTVIENLVNKTITTSGDKEQTISNGVYGIRLKGTNRIVSSETYTTKFTFFFVISADSNSSGRLITSDEGNDLFGYWTQYLGSFWMDGNINLNGYKSNDGNIEFLICRNDNDVKSAWYYHKTEKKLKKYVINSTAGSNTWGKMVIGKPVVTE